MAVSVSTIFNTFASPFKLKLLAGKNGLSQCVSWVYYTEDPETIEFIRGGELAITTGLNIERQRFNSNAFSEHDIISFLKEFIDCFITHNASGLIINIGKYLETVPDEIISYCDEKSFPLFSMPWEVHTIDIMQDIGNLISSDNHNTQSIEHFFYKTIFEADTINLNQIENTPFYDTKFFSVALVELQNHMFNNDLEQIRRYVKYFLNPKLNVSNDKYCCFVYKQKIIYVISDDNTQFVKELNKAVRMDKYLKDMKISISDTSPSLLELPSLFNHAELAMRIEKSDSDIHCYDNMGMFKILVDVKNQKTLETIYTEVFGCLNNMEPEKKEDYLKTLRLYLKYGGNLQMVADANNIHRNTAIYRISRLEELMNIDLSNGETRCLVLTALYIRELLSH